MTQNRTDLGKVVGANLRRLIKGSAYGYFCLYLLFVVCVCLDVCAVDEYRCGRQISRFRYFVQDPRKYLIHRFACKSVPEIVAECGKMRRFIL